MCAAFVFPLFSHAGRVDANLDASGQLSYSEGGVRLPDTDEAQDGEQHADHSDAPRRDDYGASRASEPRASWTLSVTLRTMWTVGTLVHALLMAGTFFVSTLDGATLLIALMGIPWSISTWVPFAMIGEFVREAELGLSPYEFVEDHWYAQQFMDPSSTASQNGAAGTAAQHRLSGSPLESITPPSGSSAASQRLASGSFQPSVVSRGLEISAPSEPPTMIGESARGGTILGIHNLAIVVPQFLMALLTSFIFRLAQGGISPSARHHTVQDASVALVLRFGGLMAFGAAFLTRLVPLTMTERQIRRSGYSHLSHDAEAGADADATADEPLDHMSVEAR